MNDHLHNSIETQDLDLMMMHIYKWCGTYRGAKVLFTFFTFKKWTTMVVMLRWVLTCKNGP